MLYLYMFLVILMEAPEFFQDLKPFMWFMLDTNDTGTVFICHLEQLLAPHKTPNLENNCFGFKLSVLCNSGT